MFIEWKKLGIGNFLQVCTILPIFNFTFLLIWGKCLFITVWNKIYVRDNMDFMKVLEPSLLKLLNFITNI